MEEPQYPKGSDWEVRVMGATVHVLPVGDIVTHKYAYCPCKPRFEYEQTGVVVIHNAFDQRPTGSSVPLELN